MPDFITLEAVKQRLWPDETTSPVVNDDLLTVIVAETCSRIEHKRGAPVLESALPVEYYDGSGSPFLVLRRGPIVSVATVEHIQYQDPGDGTRFEDVTLVNPAEYLPAGLRDEGHVAGGWLELLGGVWRCGRRNYRVTYTAGFAGSAIPPALTRAAINEAVAEFLTRDIAGFKDTRIGDFQSNPLSPEARDLALERSVSGYRVVRF